MKYTYNIFNPMDYLKLLYFVFFRWADMPKPKDLRLQIILILQIILLYFFVNIFVGYITAWGKIWYYFSPILLIFVMSGIAIISSTAINNISMERLFFIGSFSFGMTVGILFQVSIIILSIPLFILISLYNKIDKYLILKITSSKFIVVVCAIGFVVGITTNELFETIEVPIFIWNFCIMFVNSLYLGFISFTITFFMFSGTFLIVRFNKEINNKKINYFELYIIIILLLCSSTVGSFIHKSQYIFLSNLGIEKGYHEWLSLTALLCVSRIPLWPIEATICTIGYYSIISEKNFEKFLDSYKNWYFDHHIVLPLPFEKKILQHLASLDWNKGIEVIFYMLTKSGHYFVSIKTLQFLAKEDPYGVLMYFYSINKDDYLHLEGILHFIYENKSECLKLIKSAYESLNCAGDQYSKNNKFSSEAINCIFRSVENMHLANRLAGENGIRHGKEMFSLYEGIKNALEYSEIPEISNFHAPFLPNNEAPLLFPPILSDTLSDMEKIARIIESFNQATSPVTKQRILLEANEKFIPLGEKVEEVPKPAGPLLALVIAHWQKLIAEGGGQLAREHRNEPVANPYIYGPPVRGSLFVGRRDIMTQLEELWSESGQNFSVVLYGHRRMGKSSILQNMGTRFGPDTIIIDFNMQREGNISNTWELLFSLSLSVFDKLPTEIKSQIPEPEEEHFTQHNPHTSFNRFLKKLDSIHGNTRFIITIDEFELLEERISEGKLNPDLLDFFRSLIQTYPWFVMAFAGLHTLREMTQDYWHPLFGSVRAIPVSFLRPPSAYKLITQPSPEFSIDYDQQAVEHIISLTNGQPYLIQLICHGLVTAFNRQTFEEGKERERRFSLADVEEIISAPEFFRDGIAYFKGVWVQAETTELNSQTKILRTLAPHKHGLPMESISQQTGIFPEDVQKALDTLKAHDVVKSDNGKWKFTVELMRRWVLQKEGDTK